MSYSVSSYLLSIDNQLKSIEEDMHQKLVDIITNDQVISKTELSIYIYIFQIDDLLYMYASLSVRHSLGDLFRSVSTTTNFTTKEATEAILKFLKTHLRLLGMLIVYYYY